MEKKMSINIGIDVGGTKIEIIALDSESGKELYRQRINTPDNYPEFLSSIVSAVVLFSNFPAGSDFPHPL